MILRLGSIEVNCVIGDLPDERTRLQTLNVDAELEVPGAAALSDALEDTVDYARLTRTIRDSLVEAKCRMIERAAKVVLDVCVGTRGVSRAKVRVRKTGSVPGLGFAEAECSSLSSASGFGTIMANTNKTEG